MCEFESRADLRVELSARVLGLQASVLGLGLVGADTVAGGLELRVAELEVVLASRGGTADASRETVQDVAHAVEQAGGQTVGSAGHDLLNVGVGARVLDETVDALEDALGADGNVARL